MSEERARKASGVRRSKQHVHHFTGSSANPACRVRGDQSPWRSPHNPVPPSTTPRLAQASLLDMIAAKRREQASAGGGGGARHGILGLEDSSEDEEAGAGARPAAATAAPTRRPAQQPVLLLDDSSQDEAPGAGENRASNAGSAGSGRSGGQRVDAAAVPAKPLGRLVRAADRGGERAAAGPAQRSGAGGTDVDGDDDLAAQLGGLSIKPRGGAAAAAPATRAARPMPAPALSRLPAVHASRQAANREEDEEEEEAGERLVLGDDRQFKLRYSLCCCV